MKNKENLSNITKPRLEEFLNCFKDHVHAVNRAYKRSK